MAGPSTGSSADESPNRAAAIRARFVQVIAVFIVQAAILFLSAGRLGWAWAWVFLGIYLAGMVINGFIMLRTAPGTVAERGRPAEMKGWDKAVGSVWGTAHFLLVPLVAGLDERFGWTGAAATGWHLVGAAFFFLGLALFSWAMISNAHFSTVVRLQEDRDQTVCRSGPYRVVRHPGYVGANLQSLAMPLLFGSWWALLPALVAVAAMTLRTALEDRFLQAELPGYREYAQDVRWRLLPGVW